MVDIVKACTVLSDNMRKWMDKAGFLGWDVGGETKEDAFIILYFRKETVPGIPLTLEGVRIETRMIDVAPILALGPGAMDSPVLSLMVTTTLGEADDEHTKYAMTLEPRARRDYEGLEDQQRGLETCGVE